MAQNEIQKYTVAADMAANIRNVLETVRNADKRLEHLSDFLATADAATYSTLFDTATLSDLASLRTAINTYRADTAVTGFLAEIKNFCRI